MKLSNNVMVLAVTSIIVVMIGAVTYMTVHGVDSTALASILINLSSALGPLVAILAVYSKLNKVDSKADTAVTNTDKILNGEMQAKVVEGVKTALHETGVSQSPPTVGNETPPTP